jgi:long-subunit fatty acid transport protein
MKTFFTRNTFFVSCILFLLSFSFYAQSFSWEEVKYGGRLSLDLGSTNTSFIIAPIAVYPLNEQFSVGASVSFGYTKFQQLDTKLYNYGAAVLGYYYPIPQLQLSTELEQTFVNKKTEGYKTNFNFLALYLGAGYRVKNVTVGMRYDVLYNKNNNLFAQPYAPFVQFNF